MVQTQAEWLASDHALRETLMPATMILRLLVVSAAHRSFVGTWLLISGLSDISKEPAVCSGRSQPYAHKLSASPAAAGLFVHL